jgi:hypothetical protein
MKIEDRMKARILSKDSELSPDSREIIETLLNGKGLTEWLQKPKSLKRIK